MSVSKLFKAFTATALLIGAAQANAVIITIDDTSGNNGTNVSGTMDFTVTGGAGTYLMSFIIDNTSPALLTSRLTGVAFELMAGAAVTANTQPAGWGFDGAGTLPGESTVFDACFYSGSNCGAGGSGGLLSTDAPLGGFSVTFTLGGGLTAAMVEANLAAAYNSGALAACMRFISIGEGGLSDVACQGEPTVSVPEPATAALLGLGLLGLGWGVRRRRV